MSSAPRHMPSTFNCTPTTPMLSVALAETVIVPETIAPEAGAVIETLGGKLSTVTSTGAAGPGAPAASPPTAPRKGGAPPQGDVVPKGKEGGAATSAPRVAPATSNSAPAHPPA